jgi:microcystin-dependent protein
MSDPYIGQIILFAGSFPPRGYAKCDGQLIAIAENETLYTLIGTTYGGDGVTTFGLPDLQGRVPIHQGQSPSSGNFYVEGQRAGVEQVTLTGQQFPQHNHTVSANSAAGNQATPSAGVLAAGGSVSRYETVTPQTAFSNQAVATAGASGPHDNRQPYVCLYYCISLFGVFPTQS